MRSFGTLCVLALFAAVSGVALADDAPAVALHETQDAVDQLNYRVATLESQIKALTSELQKLKAVTAIGTPGGNTSLAGTYAYYELDLSNISTPGSQGFGWMVGQDLRTGTITLNSNATCALADMRFNNDIDLSFTSGTPATFGGDHLIIPIALPVTEQLDTSERTDSATCTWSVSGAQVIITGGGNPLSFNILRGNDLLWSVAQGAPGTGEIKQILLFRQ